MATKKTGAEDEVNTSTPPAKTPKPTRGALPPGEAANTTARGKDNAAANLDKTASDTKSLLKKAKHIDFLIPLADGEQPGALEVVTINGYATEVKKGEMVNIPAPVAEILANKYRVAMTAGQAARADRNEKVQEALE